MPIAGTASCLCTSAAAAAAAHTELHSWEQMPFLQRAWTLDHVLRSYADQVIFPRGWHFKYPEIMSKPADLTWASITSSSVCQLQDTGSELQF